MSTARHRAHTRRDDSAGDRAIRQTRWIGVVLVLLLGATHRPARSGSLDSDTALVLAAGVAGLLCLVTALFSLAARTRSGHRSTLAALGIAADTAVVVGLVFLLGLPPESLTVVLLLLPFLEAALCFGIGGLAITWVAACVAVSVPAMTGLGASATGGSLVVLMTAMPVLLLATVPVAMLAEHLVAQVGLSTIARRTADDRAHLLAELSAVSSETFPLQVDEVLRQLVSGAERLGATRVSLARDTGARPTPGTPAAEATTVVRQLQSPGAPPYVFTAVLRGEPDAVARRVEALELLLAQGRVALANARLVEELDTVRGAFELQATRDQLTGLLNRRGLVTRARDLASPLGLLFCDLDGFKQVNDVLGHAAGDELLEQVAHRLAAATPSDALLGRMGGDEFVLVVPAHGVDGLDSLRIRFENAIAVPFALSVGPATIGVSIGSARSTGPDQDLEVLLTQADERMYQAKRERRSRRDLRVPDTVGA